jgi:hypothetical protein
LDWRGGALNFVARSARDPVDTQTIDLLGGQLELQPLADHAGQKATDRVRCQPVAFIMASIVAPLGACSIAITSVCFESPP